MQVSRFSCPHCSARLRIRDRMYVGKIVACPDCSQQFEVISDGAKGLAARRFGEAQQKTRQPSKTESTPSPGNQSESRRETGRTKDALNSESERSSSGRRPTPTPPKLSFGENLSRYLKNPVTICWIVALIAAGSIAGLIVSRSTERAAAKQTESASNGDSNGPKVAGKKTIPGNTDPWHAGEDAESRLRRLGQLLAAYYEKHGHFPRGTVDAPQLPPDRRLSWMASLAAESKGYSSRKPQWDRPWNDVANEPFARQAVPLYRNPVLNPKPGPDGLPVSHYVGVAGVGTDGPLLPADHRRAGIFAYHRSTRREEIRDGVQNTMMIAGITAGYGGWVAGGPKTIRPFTKTPYVNGPDGFGTGTKGSMMVLMADGSVREVSRKTSPVVVRRMAAMADGFSLNPNVPGDPLDFSSPKKKDPPLVAKKKDPALPVQPAVVAQKPVHVREGLPLLNVAGALSQPILRFEHSKGVALKTVLAELEEVAGVPIRIDDAVRRGPDSPLESPVRVKLEKVTLGKILKTVLTTAGLSYRTDLRGILVITAPATNQSPPPGGP